MSMVPKLWSGVCTANWFRNCFQGLCASPAKRRRSRSSRSRRRISAVTMKSNRGIRPKALQSGDHTAVPELLQPLPDAPEVAKAQPMVTEAQPEEMGTKPLDGSLGAPALPEQDGLAATRAFVPEDPESIPRPLSPRASALRDLAPAAGIEASPALVSMLMDRVRHTGPSPVRSQRQITSGADTRPQGVAYQVQVSAPVGIGNGLPSGLEENTSLAVNASISPMGPASVPRLLDDAPPVAADATISSRRINVPWALFPYLFDLVPAIDGVPCDGLLMLGKLVAVMSSSGFRLKAASKCPDNDASTMLELHTGVAEKEWKVLQENMWGWGIVVMNMRVPLELSPNRSLILQMFD